MAEPLSEQERRHRQEMVRLHSALQEAEQRAENKSKLVDELVRAYQLDMEQIELQCTARVQAAEQAAMATSMSASGGNAGRPPSSIVMDQSLASTVRALSEMVASKDKEIERLRQITSAKDQVIALQEHKITLLERELRGQFV
eukprot:m.176740 g.176740  ORF g.176740 m.176740 type:complete len:143 (-) comp17951_c1_seq2:203-631(-)